MAEKKSLLSYAEIVLGNMIPVIGIIFFQWSLFEISVIFLAQSCAKFLVFFVDNNFVRKSTRFPAETAIGQIIIFIPFFGGLVFGYILVLYAITGTAEQGRLEDTLFPLLIQMQVIPLLIYFLSLEFVVFYSKIKNQLKHPDDNFYRVVINFFQLHILVVIGIILSVTFMSDLTPAYFLLVCLKISYEVYAIKKLRKIQ